MVLVQNLINRNDKRLVFNSHAHHALIPECSFYEAINGNDAGYDVLADLNSEEGVAFHKRQEAKLGQIAADLTYFKMLKQIAAGDTSTLILLDDQRLTVPWYELQYILQTLPDDWKILQLYYFTEEEGKIVKVQPIKPYAQIGIGLLGKGIDACYYTPEGASWAMDACWAYSDVYRLEQCLRKYQERTEQKKGLYTSLIPLAEDIGGKDFWTSDQRETDAGKNNAE